MFTNNTNIMLYVSDVEKEKYFWNAIGFQIISEETIMGYASFGMKSHEDGTTHFTVYDEAFIRQFSPEVADFKPSILFETNQIGLLRERVAQHTETASQVNQEPFPNFNFASPSGHYFAVKGI